jgi:lysophospholipase L1-like esterase
LAERRLRLPPLAAKLLLALGAAAITIGVIEGATRVLSRLGVLQVYSAMKTMLPPGGTEDWRMAHITSDRHREPDPVLLWRPVPGGPYSSQGFKGPEVAEEKPPGTFRIICYGDSNTDGPRRGGWPERLQELLDGDRSDDDPKYEVLNAGVSGYSSYQGVMRFRGEVARFRPDLVLVSFGWNDIAPAIGQPDKQFEVPPAPIVALRRALLHLRFYRVVLHSLQPEVPAVATQSAQPRVAMRDYVDNAREFAVVARDHGAKVALLTRPHRDPPEALEAMAPSWRSSVPAYNGALRQFGAENGVPVLDVQAAFADRPERFADECHFTLDAHGVMASWLAGELRSARLLPP